MTEKKGRSRRGGRSRRMLVLVLAGLCFLSAAVGATACGSSVSPAPSRAESTGTEQTKPEGEPSSGPEAPCSSREAEKAPEEPVPNQEMEEERLEARVGEILAGMSLRERVLQMFLVTPEQLAGVEGPVSRSGEATRQAIQANPVGGVIYFADNLRTPEQCTAMISDLQSYAQLGLFIAVDEEGGSVARLGRNSAMGMTRYASMASVGATGEPDNAYQAGLTIGGEIARFGFNLDFAPVADVNSNPGNPVIGARAFSSDARTAAEMVAACVRGFSDSGVLCTLKHFPGHGDTAADTHAGAAETAKTLEELEECELLPFRAGIEAGAQLVMVGHISLPAVTGDHTPASLSYEIVTGLLRQELGFSGLAVTDSMSMAAITGFCPSGQAAVRAVQAGIDLILMPEDLEDAVEGILSAVERGELSGERIDESVTRILRLKLEQGIIPLEAEH